MAQGIFFNFCVFLRRFHEMGIIWPSTLYILCFFCYSYEEKYGYETVAKGEKTVYEYRYSPA